MEQKDDSSGGLCRASSRGNDGNKHSFTQCTGLCQRWGYGCSARGLNVRPTVGALAGAIGSSLADILLGYSHWAPWTFVIKGLEGLIAGRLAHKPFVGAPTGAGIMVFGYFIAGSVFYGWVLQQHLYQAIWFRERLAQFWLIASFSSSKVSAGKVS